MLTEHLPGRPITPSPAKNERSPSAPESRQGHSGARSWRGRAVVVLGVVSMMGCMVLAYEYLVWQGPIWFASQGVHRSSGKTDSAALAKKERASVQQLPKWVELGIVHTTKQLASSQSQLEQVRKKLASAQASIASLDKGRVRLQKTVGNLTAENMQLKVQIRQAEQSAADARLALRERAVPAPVQSGLAAMKATSATGPNGIVALARKVVPPSKGKKVTPPAPAITAKGWLTIAVHGTHAVVQTPAGQVALVHVGSRLDGALITRIDARNKAVVLNHQHWVYPPK
ncbi:hypothetical protein [Acidithiobacillus thiooxidans]|nr:hypothetical protein [Acidithiobacillus thiooxidans]MDX5935893.1 hypothetical protein [Acidithiobacillus thiooxidans]